jgi:hypothetical protein
MRKTAAVSPVYLRAALEAWGYFDERGPYMQRAFRDAIERRSRTFAGKKETAMIGLLRRVADGEAFTMPGPVPGWKATEADAGMIALRDVMAAALRAVPGAWAEFNEGAGRGRTPPRRRSGRCEL